jgi:starvation-inducible DNA-binding protein
MKAHIGIKDEHLTKTSDILNTLLADEAVLYIKTRNYHWNVTGPGFSDLHKFFQEQYEQLDEIMDEVAERVRKLGHFAIGALHEFSKNTRLQEGEDQSGQGKMIKNLLNDHEAVIRSIREQLDTVNDDFKDQGTADFLTGVMEQHEKMAWMLRAYLS